MLKGISFLVSFCFFFLLVLATTREGMVKVQKERYKGESIFSSDRYRYGDLYGFCYLPKFRKLAKQQITVPLVPVKNSPRIHLVAMCDSYVWDFLKRDSILEGVKKLSYSKWNEMDAKDKVALDPNDINVLLIEIIERDVRWRLDTLRIVERLKVVKPTEVLVHVPTANVNREETKLMDSFFNPNIEKNLDVLLFDYSFLSRLKELKAVINYFWFSRANEEVTVSKTKDYLYYYNTTDSSLINSSFCQLKENEMSGIVKSFNALYLHFKNLGFHEVYLTIPPSPVTIVEPTYGKYNGLLSQLSQRKDLKMPYIDLYSDFTISQLPLYKQSDTHWNNNGFNMWVNKFNLSLDSLLANNPKGTQNVRE